MRHYHYRDTHNDPRPLWRNIARQFHIGDTLLLRDQVLRCFDTRVEFRAADDLIAVVILYGRLE
jgi:hypothetical protein